MIINIFINDVQNTQIKITTTKIKEKVLVSKRKEAFNGSQKDRTPIRDARMSEVFKRGKIPLLLGILIKQIFTQKKIGKVDEEKDSHLHSSNQNHMHTGESQKPNVQNNHSQYKN